MRTSRFFFTTLKEAPADLAILPRGAFGFEGSRTLDEWSVEDLQRESGIPIRLGRTAAELVALTTRSVETSEHPSGS